MSVPVPRKNGSRPTASPSSTKTLLARLVGMLLLRGPGFDCEEAEELSSPMDAAEGRADAFPRVRLVGPPDGSKGKLGVVELPPWLPLVDLPV